MPPAAPLALLDLPESPPQESTSEAPFVWPADETLTLALAPVEPPPPEPERRPAPRTVSRPRAKVASLDPVWTVLRWRVRTLLTSRPEATQAAIKLFPSLLQARFPLPLFRDDPPGVERAPRGRRLGALVGRFGLPAPSGTSRDRRLVSAVFALPDREKLCLLVVPRHDIWPAERARVQARVDAALGILRRQAPELSAVLLSTGAPLDPSVGQQLLWRGVLLAGRPTTALMEAAIGHPPTRPELRLAGEPAAAPAASALPSAFLGALVDGASSKLEATLLLLLAGRPAPTLPDLMRRALEQGISARLAADGELLAALWATDAGAAPDLVLEALWGAARSLAVRALAHSQLARRGRAPERGADHRPMVLRCARALTLATAKGLHRLSRADRGPLLPSFRELHLARGAAEAIGPVLRRLHLELNEKAPFPLREKKTENAYELRDPLGTCVGRGKSVVQARVRALTLLSGLWGGRVPGSAPEVQVWQRVAERVTRPVTTRTLVLWPQLGNNGLGLGGALAMLLRPGARPSARMLTAVQTLELITLQAWHGTAIEVLADEARSQPLTAMLSRLAQTTQNCAKLGRPIAVANETQLVTFDGRRHRHLASTRFLLRPRRTLVYPGGVLRPASVAASGPTRLRCQVQLLEDRVTCLLSYQDEEGAGLEERVPLRYVWAHIQDTEELLRRGQNRALVSVRADAPVEAVAARRLDDGRAPVLLSVRGETPHRPWFELGGARFGAGQVNGFVPAAQVILAGWPLGQEARIGVRNVEIDAGPLERLYARSLVLRKLWMRIDRELRRRRPSGT